MRCAQAAPKSRFFSSSVMAIVCVEGTLMYLIENSNNPGFSSIPQSIYWSIVTLTTVGYGDVSPVTVLGKIMASVVMLTGFAIIAVPTGVVTAELGREMAIARDIVRKCPEWQLAATRNEREILSALRDTAPMRKAERLGRQTILGAGRDEFRGQLLLRARSTIVRRNPPADSIRGERQIRQIAVGFNERSDWDCFELPARVHFLRSSTTAR